MTQHRTQDEADVGREDEARVETPTINKRPPLHWSNREVVIGWCIWLMGSWVVNYDLSSPLPTARWMVFSSLVGMTLVWPAWRLSAGRPLGLRPSIGNDLPIGNWNVDQDSDGDEWPKTDGNRWISVASVLIDWINLNLVFQAILWTVRLIAGWSIDQTLSITYVLATWSFLCHAIVAWGILKANGMQRFLAMAGCVAVWFVEPALISIAMYDTAEVWPMWISPLGVFDAMTQDSSSWSSQAIEIRVVTVAGMAGVLWVWVALIAWVKPYSSV